MPWKYGALAASAGLSASTFCHARDGHHRQHIAAAGRFPFNVDQMAPEKGATLPLLARLCVDSMGPGGSSPHSSSSDLKPSRAASIALSPESRRLFSPGTLCMNMRRGGTRQLVDTRTRGVAMQRGTNRSPSYKRGSLYLVLSFGLPGLQTVDDSWIPTYPMRLVSLVV